LTAREFLRQALDIDSEIRAKQNQLELLRDQAMRVASVMLGDKVQTSIKPDRLGDMIARIADLSNAYADDVNRLTEVKKEIQAVINKTSRAIYRSVLTEKYINFKGWWDISAATHYARQTLYRYHARAIKEIESHRE